MAVAVPPLPHGRSRDGSMGFFCGSLGWDPALEQSCPTSARSAPGLESPPCPGTAGVSIPCTQGTTAQTPPGQEGMGASPASAPVLGLGISLAPLSCLQPQQDRIPGFPESSYLPIAPQTERSRVLPAASSLLPAQWLLSSPAAATKGPLWARGSRGQSAGVLPAGPLPAPRPAEVCPCPPPAWGRGWAGSGARNSRKRDLGRRASESSGEGSTPGRAALAVGSSALGPGALPAWAEPDFPPQFILVPGQGREVRLQGRGHAGSDADFHLEIPSGLLTGLGDTTKPQEIHRERGVGISGSSCFTPTRDPFAELHPQQRSCWFPVLQAVGFRQKPVWISAGVQCKPS